MKNLNKMKIAPDMQYEIGQDKVGYFPEWSVKEDETLWQKVNKLAHSTFDRSKFTVVGSPNITDDGIASGFSSSNYLTAPSNVTTYKNFRIDLEFDVDPSLVTLTQDIFGFSYNGYARAQLYNSGKINFVWAPTGGGIVDCQVTFNNVGTHYQYSTGYDGTRFFLEVECDGVKKTYEAVRTMSSALGNVYIGKGYRDDSVPFTAGSIDLKQFSITVDGVEVFSGNRTGIDTIKPDNYTVVGTPTISADGIMSGLTYTSGLLPNDYIISPVSFSSASDFDIVIKNFTVSGSISQRILTGLTSSDTELYCYIYRAPNSSGISFVFGQGNGGIVYCGITEGNIVNCKLSKRGNVLTWDVENVTKSNHPAPTVVNYTATDFTVDKILLGGGWVAWEGTIDLNGFEVYVDGDLVYQPCLKIPYTEGINYVKVVNKLYRDRVKDLFEQKGYNGYYTIGEDDFTLPSNKWSDVIEHKENGLTVAEQRVDQTLTIRGACEQGVDVNLPMEFFSDDSYAVFGVGTIGTNTASKFTPAADGNYIAIGKGKV